MTGATSRNPSVWPAGPTLILRSDSARSATGIVMLSWAQVGMRPCVERFLREPHAARNSAIVTEARNARISAAVEDRRPIVARNFPDYA